MNKNAKLLKSFTTYCEFHSELRFWQALRNWSGYNFIYGSNDWKYSLDPTHLEDTYYIEEK
jgi:hypothetical protein